MFNKMLKHLAVLQADMAISLLPEKTSGTFKTAADLNNAIKKREQLMEHAKIMCNWIYQKVELNHADIKSHCSKFNFNLSLFQDEIGNTKESIDIFSNNS